MLNNYLFLLISILLLPLNKGFANNKQKLFFEKITFLQKEYEDLNIKMNHSSSEITLLHEKIEELENKYIHYETIQKKISQLFDEITLLKKTTKDSLDNVTKSLLNKTKNDDKLIRDFSTLKKSFEAIVNYLDLCEEASKNSRIYTVTVGDTLNKIASRHKVSIETLKKLNKIKGDSIYAGQKILLPEKN